MRVLVQGEWVSAEKIQLGTPSGLADLEVVAPTFPVDPVEPTTEPTFYLSGASSPILLAEPGASVQWIDTSTGSVESTSLTPSLAAGTWALRGDLEGINTVNFGYLNTEDSGRFNLPASYNKTARDPITRMDNINMLPNLVNLLAACPTLLGHVDMSGLASLQNAEFYLAKVESVDLQGCTSLRRLCLEQNNLQELDLTPARQSLRDLRAAGQLRPGLVVSCTGNLPLLYHYCTRGNAHCTQVSVSQMPVVEQWWTWRCNMTYSDTPVSPVINSLRSYDNAFDQDTVDRLLGWVASSVTSSNGTVRLDGGTTSPPSATGLGHVSTIRAKGIGVDHN